uniref:C2H2 transcriptional factor n=1 Tax=Mycena chlorophos TaxID=658473 RepID=A0ABQ0M3E9_MYCCL|nr:C2H2 transcriptional factor [Mycena chlorophos]
MAPDAHFVGYDELADILAGVSLSKASLWSREDDSNDQPIGPELYNAQARLQMPFTLLHGRDPDTKERKLVPLSPTDPLSQVSMSAFGRTTDEVFADFPQPKLADIINYALHDSPPNSPALSPETLPEDYDSDDDEPLRFYIDVEPELFHPIQFYGPFHPSTLPSYPSQPHSALSAMISAFSHVSEGLSSGFRDEQSMEYPHFDPNAIQPPPFNTEPPHFLSAYRDAPPPPTSSSDVPELTFSLVQTDEDRPRPLNDLENGSPYTPSHSYGGSPVSSNLVTTPEGSESPPASGVRVVLPNEEDPVPAEVTASSGRRLLTVVTLEEAGPLKPPKKLKELQKFACPHCPKRFTRKNGLDRHRETAGIHRAKDAVDLTVICSICGEALARKDSLARHQKKKACRKRAHRHRDNFGQIPLDAEG